MHVLDKLNFDNSYGRLPGGFYTRLEPTPLVSPYLVSFNARAADLIDLDPGEAKSERFLAAMAGNAPIAGADPLAMLYSGHQFGHYVPQLGDGRAILLGEIVNRRGERWTLQLKGSGKTPYSRGADGRAVLRSTIREYLCSEAMHGLGIPTTRALCIVGAEEPVIRESVESAAVLARLAASHVRFGSFEVFYYRRQHDNLRLLADYVIAEYFPEFADRPDRYFCFFAEVVERTARLIAAWQAVGFMHGVMNTDNMSILGLTLDYGPFGFMEGFDFQYICNHSDELGRYSYERQPHIGLWNLTCLAQALTPLMPLEQCNDALARYEPLYVDTYSGLMRNKLGLETAQAGDRELIMDLLGILAENRVDYTLFFRRLGTFGRNAAGNSDSVRDLFLAREAFDAWSWRYKARLGLEDNHDPARRARMNAVNPKYVLRNYLAELAIRNAADDRNYSEIDRLLTVVASPFDEQSGMEAYASPSPDWARRLEVSCSS